MVTAEKRRRKVTLLHLACFTVSITILLAGLWPFQFHPENHVAGFQTTAGFGSADWAWCTVNSPSTVHNSPSSQDNR